MTLGRIVPLLWRYIIATGQRVGMCCPAKGMALSECKGD